MKRTITGLSAVIMLLSSGVIYAGPALSVGTVGGVYSDQEVAYIPIDFASNGNGVAAMEFRIEVPGTNGSLPVILGDSMSNHRVDSRVLSHTDSPSSTDTIKIVVSPLDASATRFLTSGTVLVIPVVVGVSQGSAATTAPITFVSSSIVLADNYANVVGGVTAANGTLAIKPLAVGATPPANPYADNFSACTTSTGQLDSDCDGMSDAWEDTAFTRDDNTVRRIFNKFDPYDGAADYDGDGLTNVQEFSRGANPAKWDTDGDGIPDGSDGFPTDATESLDSDGDGLGNNREAVLGTNPNLADTDKEGLNDYDEVVKYATKPLLADTDTDGLSDYDEVTKYVTNPLVADTDKDSMADGPEVTAKRNPLVNEPALMSIIQNLLLN